MFQKCENQAGYQELYSQIFFHNVQKDRISQSICSWQAFLPFFYSSGSFVRQEDSPKDFNHTKILHDLQMDQISYSICPTQAFLPFLLIGPMCKFVINVCREIGQLFMNVNKNMMLLGGQASWAKMMSIMGKLIALACHLTKFVNNAK